MNKRHGHTIKGQASPTYNSWRRMLYRCEDPRSPAYKYYGARGITVTGRWYRFENFLADMGERPNDNELDRIDNRGNYEPRNCQWLTQQSHRAKTTRERHNKSRHRRRF